jgi:protein gp37
VTLFHPDVSFDFIDRIFDTMRAAHWHTFQVLTKRPNRALTWYANETDQDIPWPKNVWMGVSVENQDAADERIPHLLRLPPRVRFLSCEPLLGPVRFEQIH